MKALMKQAIVEALATNDMDVERGGLYEQQLKHLNFVAWTNLMQQCMKRLTALLNRIRAIHDIQLHVVTMDIGRQEEVLSITSLSYRFAVTVIFSFYFRCLSVKMTDSGCNSHSKRCCNRFAILLTNNVAGCSHQEPKTVPC